jgi:hypothetical protein
MEVSNEDSVHLAKGGDKNALDALVQRIQNPERRKRKFGRFSKNF